MKVLMLWAYYPEYLAYFYARHPECEGMEYDRHISTLLDDRFGWPGSLSRHMRAMGVDVEFCVVNDEHLQKKWAIQHRVAWGERWPYEIVVAQIANLGPDILWLPYLPDYYREVLPSVEHSCGRIATWIACPTHSDVDLSRFDMLITSHPNALGDRVGEFKQVIECRPGFDPAVAEAVGVLRHEHDVVFVGKISSLHRRRVRILADLIRMDVPVTCFSAVEGEPLPGLVGGLRNGLWHLFRRRDSRAAIDAWRRGVLPSGEERDAELIRGVSRPAVYGMDMFRTLASSSIVLNVHVDIAGEVAGNIRMFEATGVGACLATERSSNIESLFVPGAEVLTYSSAEDLAATIKQCLADRQRIETVAVAGQRRTLQDHTIATMWESMRHVFE